MPPRRLKRQHSRTSVKSTQSAKPVETDAEVLAAIPSGRKTIYVGEPFAITSIAEALKLAEEESAICLTPGTYDEFVEIPATANLASVSIYSSTGDQNDVRIVGGMSISGSVSISGITVEGPVSFDTGAPRVHGCAFHGGRHTVSIFTGAAPSLSECTIQGFDTSGLYLFPQARGQVSSCVITGRETPSEHGPAEAPPASTVGIFCDDGHTEVVNSTVRHVTTGAYFPAPSRGFRLVRTKITETVGCGVLCGPDAAPTISECVLVACAQRCGAAVRVEAGGRLRMSHSNVTGSLDLRPGSAPSLLGNSVHGRVSHTVAPVSADPPPPVALPVS
eukprot:TRINITY_DN5396_c0_g1_i1.p2 TRINITY_DN5396_c0_g1~~TRINITY_DN5396_c0_g1_i1.p2  ORF type:complete len:333 (-),score=49.89 TRINITY_DN5396_c0_g1_i1:314-1312(-)